MNNKHWRGVLPSDCVIVNYGKEGERESLKKRKKERRDEKFFFRKKRRIFRILNLFI